MYQAKVKQTEKYSDSQGEHVAHRSKLVLIEYEPFTRPKPVTVDVGNIRYIPIIISETEEIEIGDWVYHPFHEDIVQWKEDIPKDDVNEKKVLVLPEHFSDKHLQAIVDGKIKDGDEVLVKCEQKSNNDPLGGYAVKYHMEVHLDQQNHITLFPARQSLEEAINNYVFANGHQYYQDDDIEDAFAAGAEWAKKNNY